MAQQIYKYAVKQPMAFVNGSCFVNNNSNNVCDATADFPLVPSNDGWAFGTIFKPRLGYVQRLGYANRCVAISGNELNFYNNSNTLIPTGVLTDEDRYYTLFVRYGIDGTQKYLEIWLDNVYRGRTNITNDTYRFKNALFARETGALAVKEMACTYLYNGQDITDEEALNWRGNAIKGGSDELLIPFIGTGTSTTVYDVNNNTSYPIAGTITNGTSWSEQDEYFYCGNEGFSNYSDIELIINGAFNNNIDNWNNDGTSIITWNSGRVDMDRNGSTNYLGNLTLNQEVGLLKIGAIYRIECDVITNSNGMNMSFYRSSGNHALHPDWETTSTGHVIYDWRCTEPTAIKIGIGAKNNLSAHLVIDNVSLKIIGNIPASLLNIGKDVLGNDLTNPNIDNFVNGGAEYKQPITPELVHADPNYFYFTPASGTYDYSDFSGGSLDGWNLGTTSASTFVSNGSSVTLSIDGNETVSNRPYIKKSVSIVGGNTYKISFKYNVLSGVPYLVIINFGGSLGVYHSFVGNGIYEFTFTALGNGTTGYFLFNGQSYQGCITIDDIYIVDITDYADVTAKEKTIDELPSNFNDQIFWNRVSDVQVGQQVWYPTPQSEANVIKIAECKLKAITLASNQCIVIDEDDGSKVIDLEDAEVVIDNNC